MSIDRDIRPDAFLFRAAALAAASILAASAQAQMIPDDDPLLPNWRVQIALADSLLRAERLREYIDLLEELRASPMVQDRLEEYPRVLLGLARTYARLGDIDRAYDRVAEAYALSYPVWRELVGSEEFMRARSDPRFAVLIARARSHEEPWRRLWTPLPELDAWSDTLSRELRVYGVSAVWSAARESYAYFDRLEGMSWDSLFIATLAAVTPPMSTLEYYRLLQSVVTRLGDGHTSVLIPTELIDSLEYYPPVRTELVDGRVVIVANAAVGELSGGIGIGDEIVSVDGIPVERYAAESVRPWVSASSTRDRDHRTVGQFLLAGRASSEVRLGIVGADGVERERALKRYWCWDDMAASPTIDFERLNGNIGYIAINSFHDQYIVEFFDKALRRLVDSEGLIIDLRWNSGGYSRLAFEVLARLMASSFETHAWETPESRAYFHARGMRGGWFREAAGCMTGTGRRAYSRPVILLVGPSTISAAENFAVAFDFAHRGVLVGDTTAGSSGHGLTVPLPGGGVCRITTTRDYYPDGREYNGAGVAPDVVVARSIEDLRSGVDRTLQRALELLRSR